MNYLTTTETADRLGVTEGRIRQLALAGRLKGEKVGTAWVFRPAMVERFAAHERPSGRPVR